MFKNIYFTCGIKRKLNSLTVFSLLCFIFSHILLKRNDEKITNNKTIITNNSFCKKKDKIT